MPTATAYAKFAQLQQLLAELHEAPDDIKEDIAQYLQNESNAFQEEVDDEEEIDD